MEVFLSKILVFPFKSFDPVEVEKVRITEGGTLENDRRFALFRKEDGKVLSRKWETKLYRIRSNFDLGREEVVFSYEGVERGFKFREREAIERFLSEVLGYAVELREDRRRGFPDDGEAYGPTVVSRPTLVEVGSWFGLSEGEVRLRLRTNLELDGENLPPFWEDRLFAKAGETVWFKVGPVKVGGVNPCRRCPVPARDPFTGESLENFRRRFEEMRRKTLPPWAERSRFDTFYRLTVNTIVPPSEAGKVLKVGDRVILL
ncbi:MAG: MOSC domain-containing protein [Aquificae bacterium]|nr:MOSC domain-containing protein [Aquificota bacterium]